MKRKDYRINRESIPAAALADFQATVKKRIKRPAHTI